MMLGFVTTVPVTHATPAGLYAHTCNRFWECDDFEIEEPSVDIARQLVDNEPANKAKVVMGGGLSAFLPMDMTNDNPYVYYLFMQVFYD